MTCIVGLIDNNKVYMGGDSAGVDGHSLSTTVRGDSKVFQNGKYIFGFTTSFRMGQILRYRFDPPTCDHWDFERFMTTDFVDAIRKTFTEYGYGGKASDGEKGGVFLVGVRDNENNPRLFYIDYDFQVGWNVLPYNAVGCGENLALGALYATHDMEMDGERRIRLALAAAAEFSAGVSGPFNVVSL